MQETSKKLSIIFVALWNCDCKVLIEVKYCLLVLGREYFITGLGERVFCGMHAHIDLEGRLFYDAKMWEKLNMDYELQLNISWLTQQFR